MCDKFLKIFMFLCVIVNVSGSNDVEQDLKEQSMLYGIAFESENVTDCGQKLKIFVEGVNRREIWALNMLDSSGQEEKGYLFANFLWMGSMSQCRNINLKRNNLFSPYEVEFLTVMFKHNNSMQLQYRSPNNEFLQIGLCLPKSCTVQEISPIIEKTIATRQLLFLQNYPVELSLLKLKIIEENNDWMYHPWVIFTLTILLVTLLLTILGSFLEYHLNENGKESNKLSLWCRLLLCYSFPSNFKSLFDTNIKEDSLSVIHGLKSFGMFYIVMVHFPLYLLVAMSNSLSLIRYAGIWYTQFIVKSAHAVDTYFCIGGFLIAYIFYNSRKNKKEFSVLRCIQVFFQMILHRVIRLLPSYIVTIGLVVTAWLYMDKSYPMYRVIDEDEEICPTYWWRNLLFITTWYPRTEMCITWTWYLSNDMQFYVVNCVLLVFSTRFPKLILTILKSLVVYSIIQAGWLTYNMSYIHSIDESMYNEVLYYTFSVRMAPYFVGVLAGYYFSKWSGKIPISDKNYRIGWMICLIAFLYVVQGLQNPTQYSQIYITFYVSLSKFIWSSCIAWLIIACLSGNGGIINKILSHKCWILISRVTFGVYLTNLIVINIFAYTGEEPIHFSMAIQASFLFGSIATCFLAGTIFSLLFESPFVKLIKLLMTSNKNKIKIVNNDIDNCKDK